MTVETSTFDPQHALELAARCTDPLKLARELYRSARRLERAAAKPGPVRKRERQVARADRNVFLAAVLEAWDRLTVEDAAIAAAEIAGRAVADSDALADDVGRRLRETG